MPDELSRFQTTGKSWSERANLEELDAVLTASGNHRRNLLIHHTHLFAGRRALRLIPRCGDIVDFGCGTGRFLRFFAPHCRSVTGTEVTPEMVEKAASLGLPSNCRVTLTDGVQIPVAPESIDLIWVCAVLRYSLNVPDPVYDRIAREMHRVLKPGGRVVNVEMYVDQPTTEFTRDFELAGFRTAARRIVNRHGGRVQRFLQSRRFPAQLLPAAARLVAMGHYHFDAVDCNRPGLRDYLFIWEKPRIRY
jgi:ubiquinone/menaquinone biosynthesis C-methylase UbiE